MILEHYITELSKVFDDADTAYDHLTSIASEISNIGGVRKATVADILNDVACMSVQYGEMEMDALAHMVDLLRDERMNVRSATIDWDRYDANLEARMREDASFRYGFWSVGETTQLGGGSYAKGQTKELAE